MVTASNSGLHKPKANKSNRNADWGSLRIAAVILDSIDDYIYALNRDWNFIYTNARNATDLGYTPKELLGKNYWRTFPRFIGTAVETNFRNTMEKRVVSRFEWKTIYAKPASREFTVFPSAEGITVYGVDITEKKRLQMKLEEYAKNLEKMVQERTKKIVESEQSYRDLYESFGEAFIATDWELNVIHWNKAAERLTNVAAKDALGRKVYDVLPETRTVDITPYLVMLQKKKPVRFMMNTVSRQTGQAATFEVSTYPSAQGIIIIVEDKTKEEETKRLLTIGQTAGMVGHDIRNPLQSMMSSMFLIKNDLDVFPQSEEKKEALSEVQSIVEQITYVDKIVSDLQDYTRPLKPENVEVDLKGLIKDALATLQVQNNIETYVYFEKKLPKLRTDPMLLRRILLNLATNATQAMPKGGKLTVNAIQKKPGYITVVVEDTGVGIPEELKPKMFTPLFTTKAKGQGFGLAVVKRLVESLDGTISFESQKGKGTKFVVELPILE